MTDRIDCGWIDWLSAHYGFDDRQIRDIYLSMADAARSCGDEYAYSVLTNALILTGIDTDKEGT